MAPSGHPQHNFIGEPRIVATDRTTLDDMSRRERKSALRDQRVSVLSSHLVRAGHELWQNGVKHPDNMRNPSVPADDASLLRVTGLCREFDKKIAAVRNSVPSGRKALCRLARELPEVYSGGPSNPKGKVQRGDVVPSDLKCIDLPAPSGFCGVTLAPGAQRTPPVRRRQRLAPTRIRRRVDPWVR